MLAKNTKIGIIGAGPSGIYSASELIKKGYKNITVLERNNYIGGRVFTTERGTDMGAIVTNPKSNFLKMTQELGIENVPLKEVRHLDPQQNLGSRLKNMAYVVKEALSYVYQRENKWKDSHQDHFEKVSPALHESWDKFVKHHHLEHFEHLTKPATTALGYTRKAPALYHLHYISPLGNPTEKRC